MRGITALEAEITKYVDDGKDEYKEVRCSVECVHVRAQLGDALFGPTRFIESFCGCGSSKKRRSSARLARSSTRLRSTRTRSTRTWGTYARTSTLRRWHRLCLHSPHSSLVAFLHLKFRLSAFLCVTFCLWWPCRCRSAGCRTT